MLLRTRFAGGDAHTKAPHVKQMHVYRIISPVSRHNADILNATFRREKEKNSPASLRFIVLSDGPVRHPSVPTCSGRRGRRAREGG